MNLEDIMHKVARPLVVGGATAYLFLNTIIPVSCAKPETVNPPVQTENYTASETNETTIEETIPPEIAEPYKLYAPTATPEEFNKFNSALEKSYERVKEVYGAVPNIAVLISPSKSKYDVLTRDVFKDLYGENANDIPDNRFPYPISHFDISDNKNILVHEISHVVNKSLFPTYHSWFDEGMAMYASGEVDNARELIKDEEVGPIISARFDKLRDNPVSYWNERTVGVPGHAIGADFFVLLQLDYGLTPENNRTALSLLRQGYLEAGREPTREDIQKAYETALETDLNHLFSDLIRQGIMRWYSTDPAIAGTKGAEINKIIRSEFLN